MRHLFIVDPLEGLLADADTSIAFMRETARRGHLVAAAMVETLALSAGGRPTAECVELAISDGQNWHQSKGEPVREPLDQFDVVWMRKDPPFDMGYYFATHLLSMVSKSTLVVNEPAALREANEKLFALRFPDYCPETLVSRDMNELLAFRESLGGEMILKPLDGNGGEGIFHIRAGDPNANTILEVSTQHGREFRMAQRYIPEIKIGDKRIILVEGEPCGSVLRVPQGDEARANFHAGGVAEKGVLSSRDLEICNAVGPSLRKMGVVFAGIDVIGDYLTEVNVTSPTGVREIYDLEGIRIEETVLDAVIERVQSSSAT